MGNNYVKKKRYSLLDQRVSLLLLYKDSKCAIDKNELVWVGKIKPTPVSKEYTVLITYELYKRPDIWVIGDELEKLDETGFPHIFDIDGEKKWVKICVHMPREFDSYRVLAKTIIPWVVEWLYFYEIWIATGEWLGGGHDPDEDEKRKDKENSAETELVRDILDGKEEKINEIP